MIPTNCLFCGLLLSRISDKTAECNLCDSLVSFKYNHINIDIAKDNIILRTRFDPDQNIYLFDYNSTFNLQKYNYTLLPITSPTLDIDLFQKIFNKLLHLKTFL